MMTADFKVYFPVGEVAESSCDLVRENASRRPRERERGAVCLSIDMSVATAARSSEFFTMVQTEPTVGRLALTAEARG